MEARKESRPYFITFSQASQPKLDICQEYRTITPILRDQQNQTYLQNLKGHLFLNPVQKLSNDSLKINFTCIIKKIHSMKHIPQIRATAHARSPQGTGKSIALLLRRNRK